MTNETFNKNDGVDLRDYFKAMIDNIKTLIDANDKNYNQRFENVIQATSAALAASDRAVNKAEGAAEKRFEGLNELRGMALDQQRNYMPRAEVEIMTKGMVERLDKIENAQLLNVGQKSGVKEGWGWAAAIISLAIAAMVIFGRFI